MKKEFRAWLVILALNLIVVIACAWDSVHREPVEEVLLEESESELIQWKDTEVTIEEEEVEVVTEPQEEAADYEGIKFYNVPLSEKVQMHIFYECDGHNIAPNLILAWIERESYYKADAVSPYGAKGLMQISPKWHQDRMDRLGCTDLFDPYQNITVGIDFIAELKEKNSDIYWVIMAYRYGEDKATEKLENGIVTQYVIDILERASEIQRELEECH